MINVASPFRNIEIESMLILFTHYGKSISPLPSCCTIHLYHASLVRFIPISKESVEERLHDSSKYQ